jgi:hypothetical protein
MNEEIKKMCDEVMNLEGDAQILAYHRLLMKVKEDKRWNSFIGRLRYAHQNIPLVPAAVKDVILNMPRGCLAIKEFWEGK